MNSSNLTLGFVAIARPTFDMELARETSRQVWGQLGQSGFAPMGSDALVTNVDELHHCLSLFQNQALDLMVVLQATFADSAMIMELARSLDAPLLLWGVPEARTGGRLRLNSLCGMNLAAHTLTRAAIHYEYVYAEPNDLAALSKIEILARAGRVQRRLRQARIGRVGEHPPGFSTCDVDYAGLREHLGVKVVQIELADVLAGSRNAPPAAVLAAEAELGARLAGLDQVDQQATRGTLAVYVTLNQMQQEQHLNGLAVRCWPEFFTEAGCAACGAMSMLSNEKMPCGCEVDVNGTVTQLILQELSGTAAFGADIVAVDQERDGLVLWHCGLAPLSMADSTVRPLAAVHSNRRLPLLMQFPLKPGVVTLARLSQAKGDFRLVVASGEMLQAPMSFSGTSGVVRFERRADAVLDTILSEGLEHHIALTYGDHTETLKSLAKMLKLPLLSL